MKRSLIKSAKIGVVLLALAPFAPAALSGTPVMSEHEAQERIIQLAIKRFAPGVEVLEFEKDESTDLFLVITDQGTTLYISSDGEKIFAGQMYGMDERAGEAVNLTKQSMAKRVLEVEDEKTVTYPAYGKEVGRVDVFFDIDCAYCQLMHDDVQLLSQYGIKVRYIAYPRGGLKTKTADLMRNIWCHQKSTSAIEYYLAMRATTPDEIAVKSGDKVCDGDPVDEQYYMGRTLDLKGTPAIVFEDGTVRNSYMKASEIFDLAVKARSRSLLSGK